MSHCPDPKAIHLRMTQLPPLPLAPHMSQTPWTGFTPHDCPRDNSLPACPSRHCHRAKACLAAHDGLYCRRTHFSPAEQKKWQRRDPLRRELDAVLPAVDPHDFSQRMERIGELAAIRRAHAARMTARWKAGEFDHLYGPYSAKGVLMRAPPKVYVEGREKVRAKEARQGRAGDV
jgi:hypothetical protein